MDITASRFKHCDLIAVKGRVDSATAPQFAESINAILLEGRFKIVFDLAEVEFLSSAGLEVLINAQRTCKRYNRGEIALARIPASVQPAFEQAVTPRLFKIFPDVVSAVGYF